jgi:hypothetical protein
MLPLAAQPLRLPLLPPLMVPLLAGWLALMAFM